MPSFTNMNQMHPLTILCDELGIQDFKGINNKSGKVGQTHVKLHLQEYFDLMAHLCIFFSTALYELENEFG